MSCITSGQGRKHLSRIFVESMSRWRKWKAEREIESMPLDLRKDVGWPAGDL